MKKSVAILLKKRAKIVETLAWYRKVYWLLDREFPFWLYNWDYVWTAGRIVLGKRFKTCLMTDLLALMVDRTEIEYSEQEFVTFLQDYYSQEGEMPFETVNKLYKLRFLLSKIEYSKDLAQDREALTGLIFATKHKTSRSFLLKILSDHYSQAGFKVKALECLVSIPHERRRSYGLLLELRRKKEWFAPCAYPDLVAIVEQTID